MIGYFVRRLLTGVVLVLALTFLTFAVFFLIPSNPACLAIECGSHSNTSDAELAATEHRLGLDRPVLVQYGDFLWRLVRHGDLGYSYRGHFSINTTIAHAAPATASLVAGGALLLVLLALPLGAISALRPHGFLDRGAFALSLFGIALHPFVLGLLLRSAFANHLHLAPGIGYCPLFGHGEVGAGSPYPGVQLMVGCGGFRDWAYHLWVPWFVFALFFLPMYARMFRARVLQTFGERYVDVAYAKGASTWHVFRSHVFRNAVVPILPMLAMDIGTAITAAIYVETIFKLGGLGTLAVNALSGEFGGYDLPTIVGIVFVIALTVAVLNLIADIALVVLDPRITGRAGRRSVWRRADGGLHRRRAVIAVAAAAATVSASAFAAVHRGGAEATGGPTTGKAAIARYTRGSRIVSRGWSERLTMEGGWTAARQATESGAIMVAIHDVRVGPHGWSVKASIVNKTNASLTLTKAVPMSPDGLASSGGGGFSIQYRDRNTKSIWGLIIARPAAAYDPEPPPTLARGGRWNGTFAGGGNLPRNIDFHLGVGVFRGSADPMGFTLVTNHTFTRP